MRGRLEHIFLALVCCCFTATRLSGQILQESGTEVYPWVQATDRPYAVTNGLEGKHLMIAASHGYYSDGARWKWQRPPLYTTMEDLLTQSIVTQYLVPMLENAGAVVYTARERDPFPVNYTTTVASGIFTHKNSKVWKKQKSGKNQHYLALTCQDSHKQEIVTWEPGIREETRASVYVRYRSMSNSIPDARYTVYHSGGQTSFTVNQTMGSGVWVYLGTFDFGTGRNQCKVTLSNYSDYKGIVVADEVRIGGGSRKGVPLYFLGSLYNAQNNGAPDSVTAHYKTSKHYNNDIWSRPIMANYLSGNSATNPADNGTGVPLDLLLNLHTDAGAKCRDSIVGTLGIITHSYNDTPLGNGKSRKTLKEFGQSVTDAFAKDLSKYTGREWTNRGVRDGNYCETRETDIPSMILEMLSHQNFWDMRYALQPEFRFFMARSLYNALLKYTSGKRQATIAPLAVKDFAIGLKGSDTLVLSWVPQKDKYFKSEMPTGYIVYTATGNNGFDNGVYVQDTNYVFVPRRDIVYKFRVVAANSGGISFPSETLSAHVSSKFKAKKILIINAFNRLSGPEQNIRYSSTGFDLIEDPGTDYMENRILSGYQTDFSVVSPSSPKEIPENIGYGSRTFAGNVYSGNTFDYTAIHGKAFLDAGAYTFVSASAGAFTKRVVKAEDFYITDIICGAQKYQPSDTLTHNNFTLFNQDFTQCIGQYLTSPDSRLLISGAYIGSELQTSPQAQLLASELGIDVTEPASSTSDSKVSIAGGGSFKLEIWPSRKVCATTRYNRLKPTTEGDILMRFNQSKSLAAITHANSNCRTVSLAFPFENIEEKSRNLVMKKIIDYLAGNIQNNLK